MLIDVNDETEVICTKYKVVLIILTIITFICFILLFFATVKFFKVFRFKSKWLMMFFVILNLSVLARLGYFIEEINFRYTNNWKLAPIWINGIFTFLNIMFFSSAVLFNLFHWWYHIVEINHYLNDTTGHNNKITIILITCQVINYLIYGVMFVYSWSDKHIGKRYKNILYIYDVIVSLSFLMISIAFTWAGIVFYK